MPYPSPQASAANIASLVNPAAGCADMTCIGCVHSRSQP